MPSLAWLLQVSLHVPFGLIDEPPCAVSFILVDLSSGLDSNWSYICRGSTLTLVPVSNLKVNSPPLVDTSANHAEDFLTPSMWIGSMKRSGDLSLEALELVSLCSTSCTLYLALDLDCVSLLVLSTGLLQHILVKYSTCDNMNTFGRMLGTPSGLMLKSTLPTRGHALRVWQGVR